MVDWPVQEPVVEMVLSLSGARLKMTVLGLPKAPPVWPCHLPSSLGSMHETPIDVVVMSGSGAPLDVGHEVSCVAPHVARPCIQI
jgi:hypothetical protein